MLYYRRHGDRPCDIHRGESDMVEVYITSVLGTLVAEVDCAKQYELCDVIEAHDVSYGETFNLDIDSDDIMEIADEFENVLRLLGR